MRRSRSWDEHLHGLESSVEAQLSVVNGTANTGDIAEARRCQSLQPQRVESLRRCSPPPASAATANNCAQAVRTPAAAHFTDDVAERIDRYVEQRFESELNALEMRWTHNPYMDEFRAAKQSMPRKVASASVQCDAFATCDCETAECKQTRQQDAERAARLSYSDLVQQLAYDFRRFFFESWARELRQQRPFMNEQQRQLLHCMIVERFGQMEQALRDQADDLRQQNNALQRDLSEMQRALMHQQVELSSLAERVRCTQRACLERPLGFSPPSPASPTLGHQHERAGLSVDLSDVAQRAQQRGSNSLAHQQQQREQEYTKARSPLRTVAKSRIAAAAYDAVQQQEHEQQDDDSDTDCDDDVGLVDHLQNPFEVQFFNNAAQRE